MQQGFKGTLDQLDTCLASVRRKARLDAACKQKIGWVADRVA